MLASIGMLASKGANRVWVAGRDSKDDRGHKVAPRKAIGGRALILNVQSVAPNVKRARTGRGFSPPSRDGKVGTRPGLIAASPSGR